MELKSTTTTEVTFSIQDLKEILAEKLKLTTTDLILTNTTKTETIPGYDIHDCEYIEVFTGLKITYKQ